MGPQPAAGANAVIEEVLPITNVQVTVEEIASISCYTASIASQYNPIFLFELLFVITSSLACLPVHSLAMFKYLSLWYLNSSAFSGMRGSSGLEHASW